MYYCLLTQCAQTTTTFETEKIEAFVSNVFTDPEDLKSFLIKLKYWPRGNFKGEYTFDHPKKEGYIDSLISYLPEDKLYRCNKLSLNIDCCTVYIYKTQKLISTSEELIRSGYRNKKYVMLTREEMLLMFPREQ